MHAFFGNFAHLAQRPNLKTARVSQDGFLPFFKTVQATKTFHNVQTRTHPQVKGVAQNNLRTHLFQAARHHTFDGAVGAHWHEDGRLNHTVVQGQLAPARVAVRVCFKKFKLKHDSSCVKAWRRHS